MIVAVVVVVLSAGFAAVIAWQKSRPSGADLARDYLEAIRAGDVEAALAMTDEPSGDRSFLVPDAIDRDWRVVSVDEDETGMVTYEIAGPSGTATGNLFVARSAAERRISNGFAAVTFADGGLGYAEANGVRVTEDGVFSLFPGFYRFYDDRPGLLDFEAPTIAGVTSQSPREPLEIAPRAPVAGDQLVAAAQRAVDTAIDECAAEGEAVLVTCPFSGGYRSGDGGEPFDNRPAVWTVRKYPVVGLELDPERPRDPWRIVDVEPGSITMEDGPRRLDCEFGATGYTASIDVDGGVALEYGLHPPDFEICGG